MMRPAKKAGASRAAKQPDARPGADRAVRVGVAWQEAYLFGQLCELAADVRLCDWTAVGAVLLAVVDVVDVAALATAAPPPAMAPTTATVASNFRMVFHLLSVKGCRVRCGAPGLTHADDDAGLACESRRHNRRICAVLARGPGVDRPTEADLHRAPPPGAWDASTCPLCLGRLLGDG
jgi:hypothetical protein